MKREDCKSCEFFRERRWVQRYEPNNYHAIGMTHIYGWCDKYGERLVFIKKYSRSARGLSCERR